MLTWLWRHIQIFEGYFSKVDVREVRFEFHLIEQFEVFTKICIHIGMAVGAIRCERWIIYRMILRNRRRNFFELAHALKYN